MDYNQFQQPSSIDGLSSANYERELQSLKLNLQMVQNFSDDLKRQLHETEEALKKSENNNFEISQNNNLLKSEVKMLEAKADDLQKHKLDLVQMLSRKNDEIEYLKSTKPNNDDSMSFRSDDTQMLQCAESLNDVRLKEIRLNFEEKRLKNERNLYQNQIKLLQEEISTKNTELLNVRKEGNLNVMQANLKIDDQSNEIKCLHSEINRLKTMNDNKDKNISELTKSHLDLQLNCTQLEAKYNQENEAQSELISLLMKQNEEIQSDFTLKLDELEKYRELLKQAYEAHKALEERFNLMKESFKDEVKEMESEKQQLLMRLDQASKDAADTNRQLIEEQFERYFPIAVENNRSLNNKVNLSELYSQFVQCKLQNAQLLEQNQKLQAEVSNLSEQFDQEKPIMYKNYKDIELVSKRCVELQEELDRQIDIHKDLMSEKDKDIRTINQLKREIEYYNNENGFLSLQIQSLLRSEQEERGFKVPEQSPNSDITDTLTIPYELITFNGIKDLQQKNRELLRLVHRMSEDMDCDGQDFNHSSTNEIELNRLKEDLDKYKQEIEQLQSELDKKTDELNQQNKSKSNENSFEFSFHEKRDLLTENRELKHKLEKMNKDIETLRLDNMNDVRRLEEMKNKLIEETINLKAELSKQSAESFRQNGHIENLNLTNEKVLDENQTLRERNIKLNAKIENLEKNLINVSSEIETLRQQSKSIEQELHIARSQRDIAVNNESNLIQENSRINIELETQKKMVYSLKAMQTNIERMESETVRGLQQQLKQLQTNNDYYREKIEQQDEKWKKSFTDFSTQIENHQTLLEKEKNQHIDLQGKYFQLQSSYQKLLDEMKNTMATTNQNNQIEQQHSGSIVASGELCRQLASLQDEVKVLKGKLKNSELSYENLKSINSSLETNLQKLIVNNQEIKANLDNEMATRLKVIEELNVELANTRQQYETMVAEKVKIIEQMQSSNDLSISKINELNQQLSAAREATRKAREDERKVLDDLNFQTIIGIRSQEDYEKEVALRSSDAKTIQQLKSDLSDLEKRSAEKERELETLRDQLTMNRELSATQQQTLTTEMEVAKKRCSLLENVNENVLAQLDQLNNQIIALKNNSTLFALDDNEKMESVEQLLTVVKFLREEKCQLQSKMVKVEDELIRLKIDTENYQKEIESLKYSLEIEKQSSNRLANNAEFNSLVARAELVPTLTETNSKLRIDVSHLEKRVADLMEKITHYESNESAVMEMANKAEDGEVEKQILQKEIENWKSKANTLTQQLKSFDADSVKRLMSERSNLSRQNVTLQTECNKIKQELENVMSQMKAEVDEKEKILKERNNLQSTNVQLRNLARKYKAEIQSKNSSKSNDNSVDKEVQCEMTPSPAIDQPVPSTSEASESHKKLIVELEDKIKVGQSEIDRITLENELFRKIANEKDEKAKKIAEKAKQRLSDLALEKSNLIKERENLSNEIESLKIKILELKNVEEHMTANTNQIKADYESKIQQYEKELQLANKQIDELTSQLQDQPSVSGIQSTSVAPTIQSSQSTSNRQTTNHQPILQQSHQQQTSAQSQLSMMMKTTPTASIRPITVASSRSPSNRPVTMVQPTATTDSDLPSSPIVQLPQATVQPTQPIASSTSVSSSISSMTSNLTEMSEVSTSQSLPSTIQQSTHLQQQQPQPSTSRGFGSAIDQSFTKRSYEQSDEPSSSITKKMKTNTEIIQSSDYCDNDLGPSEQPAESEMILQSNVVQMESVDQESNDQVNDDYEEGDEDRDEENEEEEEEDEEASIDHENDYDDSSHQVDNEIDIIHNVSDDSGDVVNLMAAEFDEEDEYDDREAVFDDEQHDEPHQRDWNANQEEMDEDEEDEEDDIDVEDEDEDDDPNEDELSNDMADIEVISIPDSDEDDVDDGGDQMPDNSNGETIGDEVSSSRTSTTRNQTSTLDVMTSTTTTKNEDDIIDSHNAQSSSSNFQYDDDNQLSTKEEQQFSHQEAETVSDSEMDDQKQPNVHSSQSQSNNEMIASSSTSTTTNQQQTTNQPSSSAPTSIRRPVQWPQQSPEQQSTQEGQQQMNIRRQIYVRGQRLPGRRGTNTRMPRRGNYR